MSVIYFDTERTTAEIVGAITAIDDVIAPSNNGKILCVENGKIKAKPASSFDVETVLESLDVSANGDYLPESGVDGFDEVHVAVPNTYAAGDEGKVVSNGALVAQTARATEITQNGTVDTTLNNSVTVNVSGGGSPTLQSKTVTPSASQQTVQPDSGYDGLSSVVVEGDADLVAGNIKKDVEIFGVTGTYEGSGGGTSFPAVQAMYDGTLMFGFYGSVLQSNSSSVRKFLTDYARDRYGNEKGVQGNIPTLAQIVNITQNILTEPLSDFVARFSVLSQAEYSGYVYGVTSMIEDLGLVLLGDFSQGGQASGNTLSDSIENYSAVLLQGIYQMQRTSRYNTSMLYISPILNTNYWTGMLDRNHSYDCNVTFTDAQTVSLSGNKQVIIYGIP